MSTEFVYLKGKAKWVNTLQPDKFNKYGLQLHFGLNNPDLEKVRELQAEGVKNVIKKDEDGYYCNFSRKASMEVRGQIRGLAPPEILEADGKTPWTGGRVGNGSDVTIKLEVYQHNVPAGGKAKAARLASIRIDNLVPFESNRDYTDDQAGLVKGMDTEPKPEF